MSVPSRTGTGIYARSHFSSWWPSSQLQPHLMISCWKADLISMYTQDALFVKMYMIQTVSRKIGSRYHWSCVPSYHSTYLTQNFGSLYSRQSHRVPSHLSHDWCPSLVFRATVHQVSKCFTLKALLITSGIRLGSPIVIRIIWRLILLVLVSCNV